MPQLPFFKVGDFGQTIRRTIVDEKNDPVDVSDADATDGIIFYFADPDGNVSLHGDTEGATFTTNGEDGQVEYVVESTLFDEEGTWKLQVKITYTGNYVIYTEQEEFTVSPVLA